MTKQNQIILAIDYSLNGSSFIFGDENGKLLAFKYFSKLKSDHKNPNCSPIYDETSENKLDNVICAFLQDINKVDLVVLESRSFNSSNASTSFLDGYSIISYLCRRLDIPIIQIPPITNKMFFTDDAKADKKKMVARARELYGKEIDFDSISSKHQEDVADSLSLYKIGSTYLKCNRLPAPKGYVGTCDIKPFDVLPLNEQMVIAKLRGREDLYNEAKKFREKKKKLDKGSK